MPNPPTRVPAPYRGGKMYTHWARIWPPLSWKAEMHFHCVCPLAPRSAYDLGYTLRAHTTTLAVTNLAADDLQDPRLFKIILKKVCTKRSIAPTPTSPVYVKCECENWLNSTCAAMSNDLLSREPRASGWTVTCNVLLQRLALAFIICQARGKTHLLWWTLFQASGTAGTQSPRPELFQNCWHLSGIVNFTFCHLSEMGFHKKNM